MAAQTSDRKLTAKQQRFVAEYLKDLNGTQSATRAGYSARTANEQAARLLAKVSVKEAIQKAMDKRQARTEITQDYVLTTIVETIERCKQAKPVLRANGDPVLVETEDGSLVPAYTFDAGAVLKGSELLGKHLKLFTEKHELSGGVEITEIVRKVVKP